MKLFSKPKSIAPLKWRGAKPRKIRRRDARSRLYSRGCSDDLTRRSHALSDAISFYYLSRLERRREKKRYFGVPLNLRSHHEASGGSGASLPNQIYVTPSFSPSGSSSRIKLKEEEILFFPFLSMRFRGDSEQVAESSEGPAAPVTRGRLGPIGAFGGGAAVQGGAKQDGRKMAASL